MMILRLYGRNGEYACLSVREHGFDKLVDIGRGFRLYPGLVCMQYDDHYMFFIS
jgi:hypothetical protein